MSLIYKKEDQIIKSANELQELIQESENVYLDDWPNGAEFVEQFPEKIDQFLELYCDEVH